MSKLRRPRVYCDQQWQSAACQQCSIFLDRYEVQIAEHGTLFALPADYRRQILALHATERRDGDDRAARRAQVEQRLARIKDLFGWGDLEREAYLAERDRLQRELATLHDDDTSWRPSRGPGRRPTRRNATAWHGSFSTKSTFATMRSSPWCQRPSSRRSSGSRGARK